MNEEWLSTAEAGALVGRDERTVRRWVERRRLPAKVVHQGEHIAYRIRRQDLVAFVRNWLREEWR